MNLWFRVKFFVERQFLKGAHVQFFFVALLVGAISLFGGLLVLGTMAGENVAEATWWAFLRLTDPGYLGDDEGVVRRVVATMLTVGGYVVFTGTLVAILTRWLIAFMRNLELGLTPVQVKDHIVVLGWTDRTMPIIREILFSRARLKRFAASLGRGRSDTLVVLTEDLSPERAAMFRSDRFLRTRRREVILRSGSALNLEHLHRVAVRDAAAILVPAQVFDEAEAIDTDMQTIKILLSLDGMADEEHAAPPVVAEIQDMRKVSIARRAYRGPLEIVAGDLSISRLMAQTFIHPGLSRIYQELLSSSRGNELYLRTWREEATRFEEAARAHEEAVMIGVLRRGPGGEMAGHLNPGAEFVVEPGDLAVVVARSLDGEEPRGKTEFQVAAGVAPVPGSQEERLHLLILGWNSKVPTLVRELETYAFEDLEVTVASTLTVEAREAELEEFLDGESHVLEQHQIDFTTAANLGRLKPERFDQVLIMSSDRLESGEEADARSIMAYLGLEECLNGASRRPRMLLELADPSNQTLLGHRPDTEVAITPLLLSHILAQVAMRRELRLVFDELFSAGGQEFLFRQPDFFGIDQGSYSFEALGELVLARGEVLVGVDGRLNPPRTEQVEVGEGTYFVVVGVGSHKK